MVSCSRFPWRIAWLWGSLVSEISNCSVFRGDDQGTVVFTAVPVFPLLAELLQAESVSLQPHMTNPDRQNVILWEKPDAPMCTGITQGRECAGELALLESVPHTQAVSAGHCLKAPHSSLLGVKARLPIQCSSKCQCRPCSLNYLGYLFQWQVPRQWTESESLGFMS